MKLYLLLFTMVLIPVTLSCSPVPGRSGTSLVHVQPNGKKHLVAEGYRESVRIDGILYALPHQWAGRKIDAPSLAFPELTRIPAKMVYNHGELYMLEAANKALQAMAVEAASDGVYVTVHSAYRSEWYQRRIFRRMLAEGRSFDDIIRYVAPPGYSEHALGTVVDFYPSNWSFAKTAEYKWLKENALRFNFKESYPEDQNNGQPWEAWHWRWIPPDEQ